MRFYKDVIGDGLISVELREFGGQAHTLRKVGVLLYFLRHSVLEIQAGNR